MTRLAEPNRELWLWLFNEGGRYTTVEIAKRFDWHPDYAMEKIYSLLRRQHVAKFPPAPGSRRQQFGVTGTCEVPVGLTVAEVQA